MDPQYRKNILLKFAVEDQLHSEIERLLNEGADPNFADANCTDGLCTPLHIAVDQWDSTSVEILLRFGAKFDTKVRNYASPWELAQSLPGIRLIFEQHFKANQHLRATSVTKRTAEKNPNSCEYRRRPGSAGIAGQWYETKLMALVLLRLQQRKCSFYLGSNVDGIGEFDDLVVRYRCPSSERDCLLFVQAKHREDPDKNKIKFAAIEDTRCEGGNFSVHTNFRNYLKIREQFGSRSEGFFEGKFEDLDVELILYTPAKYEFALLKKVNKFDLLKTNEEGRILVVSSEEHIITNLCKNAQNITKSQNKFEDESYVKHLADDFLKKFRIYCNQAKEDQVSKIMRKEFSSTSTDLFHALIQDYWTQKGVIPFLSETSDIITKDLRYLESQNDLELPRNICKVHKPSSAVRRNMLLLFAIEDKDYTRLESLLNDYPPVDPSFVDANATNGNCTPLHVAVAVKDPKSVRILLGAGAQLGTRNDRGETAWEMAKRIKCSSVVAAFRGHFREKSAKKLWV